MIFFRKKRFTPNFIQQKGGHVAALLLISAFV